MTSKTEFTNQNSTQPEARAWQRMLSGRRLDLLSPDPEDIDINDIAHGLARVARWNGQTHGNHAFSVAQHSVIVEMICAEQNQDWSPDWLLAALLHDAAEYVIGDLISPFKSVIDGHYKSIESGLMTAIHLRFSLPGILPDEIRDIIKRADQTSAYFEATRLAGFSKTEARKFFGTPDGLPASLHQKLSTLSPVSTTLAQSMFLDKFNHLIVANGAEHG